MIEQILTSEEKRILQLTEDFSESFLSEANVSRWYKEGGIPDRVMQEYKDSGLGYLGLAKNYGGPDVSRLCLVQVVETLSRHAGTALPLQSQILSFGIISSLANSAQMKLVLSRFEKTARPCFSTAISDASSGSDISGYQTNVRREGDRLLLSGNKTFVTNGEYSPYVFVVAKNLLNNNDIAEAPFSFWLIPLESEGVRIYHIKKLGQSIATSAALIFEDVEVDPNWQVGKDLPVMESFQMVMNFGRCIVCANSLGMAQAALEDAAHFANTHIIKNRRIGDYQQIALMLTQMESTLHNMRSQVYHATLCAADSDEAVLATAQMKYYVPHSAVKVADLAMQIFGGAGYTDATRVSRIWVDCRANQFATGTDQIMATIAARKILDKYNS